MINLCDLTYEELTEYFVGLGEAKFRAKQVFSFIAKGAESIDDLTTLSKGLREKLKESCEIYQPQIERKLVSRLEGTVKYL